MASAPQTPYRFSPEEMRVIQECNRDSFYQRCIPLGSCLGVGTYMAVKAGYLQANPKWGAVPKVVGAVVIGYFLGKLSFQTKCAERLMMVPDSKLGAILRNKRYGIQQDVLGMEDKGLEKAISNVPESERYSDISNKNQLDMDLERPLMSGLEDYRPNTMDDTRIEDDTFLPSTSPTTSYDELRRRNREDYEQKRTKAYRGVVTPEEVPSGIRIEDRSPLDAKPSPPPPVNVYGDLWEK